MEKYRKLILGLAYLASVTWLTYVAIINKTDLVALSSVILMIGGGVFSLVWGNVKEHQAKNGNGNHA